MSESIHKLPITLEKLWQFGLQYYSINQIKEACLIFQNRYKGNINLLILLRLLDEENTSFDITEWPKLHQALQRTEKMIQHYRQLRRKLKSVVSDALYRETLEFELQLEKQQQSDLIDCVNNFSLKAKEKEGLTWQYCKRLGALQLFGTLNQAQDKTKQAPPFSQAL